MKTDTFFWKLFKQLPETLFALLDLPVEQAMDYGFLSEEVKKSYRLDGVFVPKKAKLPVYFVEVQFRRNRRFYANLLAKVFSYLEKYNPNQDWLAVALFGSRSLEPKKQVPYEDFLASPRLRRIYLDEMIVPTEAAPGLALMQLVTVPQSDAPELVARLLKRAHRKTNCERQEIIVELLEELLMRKFENLSREEIRKMFKLQDIRKTRVWQEAVEEGREEGRTLEKQSIVLRCISEGKGLKEIAEFLKIPLAEVRRLAKQGDA